MKITHDFHIHTSLSSCADKTATLQHYITKAKELGLKKIGIANHMWDSKVPGAIPWYQVQSFEHISQIRSELESIDTRGIKVYVGCETEYDYANHGVAITEETASQLDFILAPNSHTHITMPKEFYEPYQKHADYMLNAWYDIVNSSVAKYITAIPHPFCAVCCPYDNKELLKLYTDSQYKDCFMAAKEKNIAIEINPNHFSNKPLGEVYADELIRMYTIAKECGCKFMIGSDAHASNEHETFPNAYIATGLFDLRDEDFMDIAR